MQLLKVVLVTALQTALAQNGDWRFMKGQDGLCTGEFEKSINRCVQTQIQPLWKCEDKDFDCLCRNSHFLSECYDMCTTHHDLPHVQYMRRMYCEANATWGDLTGEYKWKPKVEVPLPEWISPAVPDWTKLLANEADAIIKDNKHQRIKLKHDQGHWVKPDKKHEPRSDEDRKGPRDGPEFPGGWFVQTHY